jgi:hypothetical protein
LAPALVEDPERQLAPALAPEREPQEFLPRQVMPQKFIPKECWHFASTTR